MRKLYSLLVVVALLAVAACGSEPIASDCTHHPDPNTCPLSPAN